jgi:hypothetical protein
MAIYYEARLIFLTEEARLIKISTLEAGFGDHLHVGTGRKRQVRAIYRNEKISKFFYANYWCFGSSCQNGLQLL